MDLYIREKIMNSRMAHRRPSKSPLLTLLLGLAIVGVAFFSGPSSGRTTTASVSERFFEPLYDVPVMSGLQEIGDQALLFDKPSGRIASVVAVSDHLTSTEIVEFYARTLPQLGWKKINKNQYVRDESTLFLDLVERPPLVVVQFSLFPAQK